MSDFLPEDLIQEILFKLPIKSLVRCASLSRTWNSLIKSPTFISKHLQRTISSTDHQSLFLLRLCSKEREEQYSLRLDNQDFNEHMQLHFPFESFESYFHVIGSCNGLICLAKVIRRFTVSFIFWNPLIQKYVNIEPRILGHLYSFVGFGYDSRANDYKLIRMVNFQKSKFLSENFPKMELYSLNEGSWRSIPQTAPLRYDTDQHFSSAFLNGFDMSDEIFLEIALPSCLDNVRPSCLSLLVYKESSISVCQASFLSSVQFHIWVMKEYGVVESWTQLVLTFGAQGEGIPRALGIRKEELLMEKKRGWIVSGDLESQQVRDLRIWGEPFHTFTGSYLESLVLLDKGNATSYGYNSNGLAA
ncbi:F-box protein [Salix suchowensis]|nr:F-box protein [Salix suchowensis]